MKDDSLRRGLEAELRSLRTKGGALDLERVATAELLTDFVGQGSPELAFNVLMDALTRHGKDPDGDIRAFYETCGIDTSGDSLNQRLDAYASVHHVDRRTGLRRSDRGATKISHILRDANLYERPGGNVSLVEDDGRATFEVWVEIPEDALWRRPWVFINDERQVRPFELDEHPILPYFMYAKETFRDVALRPGVNPELAAVRFSLNIHWPMPVWPIWQLGVRLSSVRLHAHLMTNRDGSVDVELWERHPIKETSEE